MFFINLSQGRFDFSHQRLSTGMKDKTDGGGYVYSQMPCFSFCTYSTNIGPFSNVAWRPLRVLWVVGKQWVFMCTFLLVNGVSGPRTLGNKSLKLVTDIFAGWKHLDMSLWEHVTQKEDMRACGRGSSHHSRSGNRKHGWNLGRAKPPKVYRCLIGCYFFIANSYILIAIYFYLLFNY